MSPFQDLVKHWSRLGEAAGAHQTSADISVILDSLPANLTLRDITNELAPSDPVGDLAHLQAIRSCVESRPSVASADSDEDAGKVLAAYVARAIKEPLELACGEDGAAWPTIAHKAEVGLEILRSLAATEKTLESSVLLVVAAYTTVKDVWTTEKASVLAAQTLVRALGEGSGTAEKRDFIVDAVLTQFLRPLFAKSRPATVTASGRKAEFVEPVPADAMYTATVPEQERKAWKHRSRYSIAVLEWAVDQADEELLSKSWHMYTPVLLTLLDELDCDIKTRAFSIFSAFWSNCPPRLMVETGLAEVFEEAIFPAVHYLPSLTPEAESIEILDGAYSALFQIAGLPHPECSIGEPTTYPPFTEAQRRLMDKIIREGMMVGYHHAKEHIRLVELLCRKLRSIVNAIGILSVKHLKDFIPMTSDIMTEPFGVVYPPALLAATQLLQAVLRCCWPRIPFYCNDIVNSLTICWLNVDDEDAFPGTDQTRQELHKELTKAASMLSDVMKEEEDPLETRVIPLVEKEARLSNLFVS